MNETFETLIRAGLTSATEALDPYVGFIFENERSFIERFCDETTTDIIEVTFSSESCKFVYLVGSGASIVNSATVDDLMDWMIDTSNGLEL